VCVLHERAARGEHERALAAPPIFRDSGRRSPDRAGPLILGGGRRPSTDLSGDKRPAIESVGSKRPALESGVAARPIKRARIMSSRYTSSRLVVSSTIDFRLLHCLFIVSAASTQTVDVS
jgi:hypothetical protein